jgi:isopenicillin-N epimerase
MDWHAARSQVMLDPSVTMLNTGSFGPQPEPVYEAADRIRRQLAAGPTDFFVRRLPPPLWDARVRTAAFLGTAPERLVFTSNVSAAINLVASGLRLSAPGEVLLTDHEYGAMVWCWERAARRQGLTVRTVKLPTMAGDPGEIVAACVAAMSPRTRLFFFSHVLSPTGLVLPAAELCRETRRRGMVSVVDGAHAVAMLPLNVSAVGADFYTGNLHKWLLAPTGSGFLAVGPGNEDRLEPLHVSWGYHPDAGTGPTPDSPDAYGSTRRTRHLEFEGTRDPCPWLAVPAAIDFQTGLGWEAVRARQRELGTYCRRVIPLPPATPERLSGAMTAFELPPGRTAAEWRRLFWAERIEVPVIERPGRLLVRVSHHFYTLEAEIDRLADLLGRLCRPESRAT